MIYETEIEILDPQARSLDLYTSCCMINHHTNWIQLENGSQKCKVRFLTSLAQRQHGIYQKFNDLGLTKTNGKKFEIDTNNSCIPSDIKYCNIS